MSRQRGFVTFVALRYRIVNGFGLTFSRSVLLSEAFCWLLFTPFCGYYRQLYHRWSVRIASHLNMNLLRGSATYVDLL